MTWTVWLWHGGRRAWLRRFEASGATDDGARAAHDLAEDQAARLRARFGAARVCVLHSTITERTTADTKQLLTRAPRRWYARRQPGPRGRIA
jgi:hypothetical protein